MVVVFMKNVKENSYIQDADALKSRKGIRENSAMKNNQTTIILEKTQNFRGYFCHGK